MSQEHPLDNLIWDTITQSHRHLAKIGEKAAVYDPQVFNFAAVTEDTNEAWTELAELVTPDTPITIAFKPPEKQWQILHQLHVNQMMIEKPIPHKAMTFETLTKGDVPQMIELMKLTGAAPFMDRTIEMGRYIGHKIDGKLVAMGGERMKTQGYVEISGIGTHPDYRRRGYGKAITCTLTNEVFERGETPFLHCWDGNEPAFTIYKKLGYVTRVNAPVWVIMKKPPI